MATSISYLSAASAFVLVLAWQYLSLHQVTSAPNCKQVKASETDLVQFFLNLEYLEDEFFLHAARGEGLDAISPNLAGGVPPPIGGQKANLDPLLRGIIQELDYQDVGHIRAIRRAGGGFARPLLDISRENLGKIFDQVVGSSLKPPFDVYANSVNYPLAAYIIPYAQLVGSLGAIPYLTNPTYRTLVAQLSSLEAGKDGVIRTLLYEKAEEKVEPYNLIVADFTNRISAFRDLLSLCGQKDEGIIVPKELGADKKTTTNILSADVDSIVDVLRRDTTSVVEDSVQSRQ